MSETVIDLVWDPDDGKSALQGGYLRRTRRYGLWSWAHPIR